MPNNQEVVTAAFQSWMAGTGAITSIFAPEMRWEIVGNSVAAGQYNSADEFVTQVLQPLGTRFDPSRPLRPTTIRAVYTDEGQDTVAVIWDGEATTHADTIDRNTYAWFLTLRDGKVVEATAFFDSIAFNEVWKVPPRPNT